MSNLTAKQIEEHLIALRISCDPASPFFGMVGFDSLLGLPTEQQWQIFLAMPPDLTIMVNEYKKRVEQRKGEAQK